MLTPTLLCRMSIRPQRSTAAAIAAASVASRVTSAWKATHSPPDFAASTAVSSAEERSRSTARIFAPSCAKRSTVARPLPIPSPGLCPAPITTAIFPASRMAQPSLVCFLRALRRELGGDPRDDRLVAALGALPEQAQARIPGRVLAIEQPPPIRRIGQHDPGVLA